MISFRWRDSAHKNKKRVMALPVEEFLQRFFLHVLPPGFVRIRHFGFLANRQRKELVPLCRQLLAEIPTEPDNPPRRKFLRPWISGNVQPAAARW